MWLNEVDDSMGFLTVAEQIIYREWVAMNRGKIVAIGCASLIGWIALLVLFPCINDESPAGTYVARLLQEGADAYALSNEGKCARSCRDLSPFFPGGSHQLGGKAGVLPVDPFVLHPVLYIGPPQEQTSSPNYIFDLSPLAVAELLKGNSSYLEDLRKPGCFGYGTTADQKKFVIVFFRRSGVPMNHSGMVMVWANRGSILEVSNHEIRNIKH